MDFHSLYYVKTQAVINKYDFESLIWGIYEMQMPLSERPDGLGPVACIKKTFPSASDAVSFWTSGTIRIKYTFLSPVFLFRVPL